MTVEQDAPEAGMQWIEYRRLDDLVEAVRNSKKHNLEQLGTSVEHLGFFSEPKLDERTGRLVRGHGRIALLRRLRDRGAPAPEYVRDVGDDWECPLVRGWSSRDDAHADAVMEADNNVGRDAGHDPEVQLDVLGDLAAEHPEYLRATGHDSAYLDRLLEEVGQLTADSSRGATVTDLDGLDSALAPWDHPGGDPFGRPDPPESSRDEQWSGSGMVDPEKRSPRRTDVERPLSELDGEEELPRHPEPDGPGPLDVAPAWRTLQPWRAVFHAGGPDGARAVMDFLRGHATAVHAEDGDVVCWEAGDPGGWTLLPGQWLTRDGQTGKFDTWSPAEFYDRFVPANEPARRVQRAAAAVKVEGSRA